MLKRKFHFPVSDEHFPFWLEKPLPPQHPVEGCKHVPEGQISLPVSVFLFPPKTHFCGITCTGSQDIRAIYIGAAWFFLNFLGVNS